MIADGRVRPVVHGTGARWTEAAEAHAQLEAGGVVGKLILVTPRAD